MPRILNFGSINLDHVYRVPHFVKPGETLASSDYQLGFGGKGFNQSIALARAGASVCHAGAVGKEGRNLVDYLSSEGVDVDRIGEVSEPTGHAIIQVDETGENSIVLYPGANHTIGEGELEAVFADLSSADHFLCQNETSALREALLGAWQRGMTVWFNPAPMGPEVLDYPLELVDWLIVNETEAAALCLFESPDQFFDHLGKLYPQMNIVLTLGSEGVKAYVRGESYTVPAQVVPVVDTTAAGDTFIGFLAAGIISGLTPETALQRAVKAAALCVSRCGAAASIPYASEL